MQDASQLQPAIGHLDLEESGWPQLGTLSMSNHGNFMGVLDSSQGWIVHRLGWSCMIRIQAHPTIPRAKAATVLSDYLCLLLSLSVIDRRKLLVLSWMFQDPNTSSHPLQCLDVHSTCDSQPRSMGPNRRTSPAGKFISQAKKWRGIGDKSLPHGLRYTLL